MTSAGTGASGTGTTANVDHASAHDAAVGSACAQGALSLPRSECKPFSTLPGPMVRELRSDHAGEAGAVCIYRGILAVSRDPEVRAFAETHLATERAHLAFFERELPRAWRSAGGPLWRLAGWLLGALPALLGRRAVYRTIEAVETFVDHHYAAQIDALDAHADLHWLRDRLVGFRADEVEHRDDAAARLGPPGALARAWAWLIAQGSAAGVVVARRL